MWLAVLLFVGVLPIQGDLNLFLEQNVYLDTTQGLTLELFYEIPFSSLTFLRGDSGFVARFNVGVELYDAKGNPVAGDLWQRFAYVSAYGAAADRDSVVSGSVSVAVPEGARRVQVLVADAASDRRASAISALDKAPAAVRVWLYRRGKKNQSRVYQVEDTFEALAELAGQTQAGQRCTFSIRGSRRVLMVGEAAVFDSAGRSYARYSLALADSNGAARLSTGEYELEVRSGGKIGRTSFWMKVPFFQDDKAYREKVEELLYIATAAEMAELKKKPRAEREQAWRDFWKKRDPSPTTEHNEKEEEYFRRITYAKEHFGGADKGYRSDRGRIYVTYGPPDNIVSRPFEIDARASETWYYYSLGREFTFVDRYGFGVFVLTN